MGCVFWHLHECLNFLEKAKTLNNDIMEKTTLNPLLRLKKKNNGHIKRIALRVTSLPFRTLQIWPPVTSGC